MRDSRFFFLSLAVSFLFLLSAWRCDAQRASEATFVQVKGEKIQVELARSSQEWAKGLMFRKELGDRQGMFFVGSTQRPLSFWMKNTYVSLDIIYIDKNLKVVSIAENTKPLSEDPIPSEGPATHVLEVKAGVAKELGLKKGDSIKVLFEL